MTPDQFKAKFGVPPEEYAEGMRVKLVSALARKTIQQDQEIIQAAVVRLHEVLAKHFHRLVSEGAITDWSVTLGMDGNARMKVTSLKELADSFRGKGFDVEEKA